MPFCLIIISVAVILVKRCYLFVHSEVIRFVNVMFQAFDAVCHHQIKHREESWKYDGQRGIFDELRGVSSGDETASNAWYFLSNKMILEGKIKDIKNEQFFIWFPNTHETLISFAFSLWIINEFEKFVWLLPALIPTAAFVLSKSSSFVEKHWYTHSSVISWRGIFGPFITELNPALGETQSVWFY